jgi:starch synthase
MTADPCVAQITSGRFHHLDLARQLEKRGLLQAICTGYPSWKLRQEGLPFSKIRTFPWLLAPYHAGLGRGLRRFGWAEGYLHLNRICTDKFFARTLRPLPDVLIAMSGHGADFGPRVQAQGGAWICERASTHGRHHALVMREEYRRWHIPYHGLLERVLAREDFEYAEADCITIPSRRAEDSLLRYGVPAAKIARVPYGVDLTRFGKTGEPPQDEFRIVYVGALSVRKGIGHLLEAFKLLRHAKKRLTLIGSATPETPALLKNLPENVMVLGHRPQSELVHHLSRSHVFVLCSIEEGLAHVLGQALASGCPVVATAATGAEDLITDGTEGFIIPYPKASDVAAKLEELAQNASRRQAMSDAALRRVQCLGGWDSYGDAMEVLVRGLARRVARS